MSISLLGAALLHLIAFATALATSYALYKVVYNIYFHPLAKFPGPWFAVISNAWYAKNWPGGRWPFILEDLHKKYGPIVRYAPNDLGFATAESYQDMHGQVKAGKQTFLKSEFYKAGPDNTLMGIVAQRDPVKHRETRKSLSHAFSAKALRLQTDVVLKYVDMWVGQVKRLGNTEEGINTEECYNWLTFDIIGDLAFGEPFGAVEKAESHPWVTTIQNGLFEIVFYDVFRRVPLLKLWPSLVRPTNVVAQRSKQFQNSRVRVDRRMQQNNHRDDFFSHLLSEKATDLTPDFLTAQANTLIIAGSETTATFLTGTTYYLVKNPTALHHLTNEIRTAFKDPSLINGDTTQSLPYLNAVIEESLRIFPPVPAGLQRTTPSPGAYVSSHYVPGGTTVSVSAWSLTHSPKYFHKPREFRPERWLPQDHELYDKAFEADVRDASKPFLVGPRACLGINLAYLEMRIILARICWEFDLEWGPGGERVEWERDVKLRLLWQKPELRVRFRPAVR